MEVKSIMSNIITAKQSPRLQDGKIVWYEGDTFSIALTLSLTDEVTNEDITLDDTSTVIVSIYKSKILVHRFTFNSFENNQIVMVFNDEVSGKFSVGEYNYTITHKCLNTTTLVANNIMEVEPCLQ